MTGQAHEKMKLNAFKAENWQVRQRYLWFLNVGLTVSLEWRSMLGVVREHQMSDVIFVLCTVVFFALGILYVKGCERLK
jgi:hypothetical protein